MRSNNWVYSALPNDGGQNALREAAANIPVQVAERLNTAEILSAEECETIIQIALKSLALYQPKAEHEPQPDGKS